MLIVLFVILIIYIPFILFHSLLAIFIKKRNKFIYYGSIISFALGLSSIITIIPAILLFIKWLDNEVKSYYLDEITSNDIKSYQNKEI